MVGETYKTPDYQKQMRRNIFDYSLGLILIAVAFDLAVVATTIGQIENGQPTPNIPFWDAQIAFVTGNHQ